MVHEVSKAVDEGILDKIQVSNDVDEWCVRMERDGSYVDHTFIEMTARILDSDIVVVSLHGNAMGPGHVIRAGLLDGTESARARPGKNVPIFIGYFEDELHTAGHFQSLMPFRDSEILDMVKSDGGVNTAEILHLPLQPCATEEAEMSFTPSVNSTQFQTPAPVLPPHSIQVTPPPPGTPFQTPPPSLNPRMAMLEAVFGEVSSPQPQTTHPSLPSFPDTVSVSPMMSPAHSPVKASKPQRAKRAKKRLRTPSPTVSPIPILRYSLKNKENDEWMKLAAATRKSRRIRKEATRYGM